MALQRIDTAFGPNPVRFNGNIQPQANANVFLGNTSFQFSTIYAATFSGTATNANLAYFLGSGTAINPSSANVAGNIVGYATTVSGNVSTGAIVSRGGLGVAGIAMIGGNLVAASGTVSSSTTTGALVVNGGVGISGAVFTGGIIDITNNTQAISTSTGALLVDGGVSVSTGNLYIGGSAGNAIVATGDNYNQGNIWVTNTTNAGLKTNQTTAYVFNETATMVKIAGGGITEFDNNTQAISTTTGAVQIVGGVSIATGNLFIGGSAGRAITVTGNIVPSANLVATNNLGSDTLWWNNFYGVSTQARYADLAENYQADSAYEPGTVLEFGGEFELTIAQDASRKVAGVVSTNPAHLMNGMLRGPNVVPLALQGRTPCKVRGKISKGDMLISGGNGYARPDNSPQIGTVIGKALEDFEGVEGVIEVVVGRM